jgi:hypothetical protein
MPRPKTGDKRAAILRATTKTIAEDGIGVAESGDDAWVVVVGEEDSFPVVLGEDGGMSVVNGFKFRQGPSTELAEAEVGAAELNGVRHGRMRRGLKRSRMPSR